MLVDVKRVEVVGVPVDCVDVPVTHRTVGDILSGAAGGNIIAVNPEKVMRARSDPRLLDALRGARLLIPDGIGVVLAARILGLGRMSRVPGSELMPAICEIAAREGRGVFLFGASPEVNAMVAQILPERYPGLRIAGRHHGYVKDDEMPSLIDEINRSRADVLFVALGSPKQEYWMAENGPRLNVRTCQGVGGTFDVIAGRIKRAPALFINLHLEWLYRLLSQPSRAGRQKALPQFALMILREWFAQLLIPARRSR